MIKYLFFSLFICTIFLNYIYQNYHNLSFINLFKILSLYRFIFLAFFISIIYLKLSERKKKFFLQFNFF